jgi:hypothetical protein
MQETVADRTPASLAVSRKEPFTAFSSATSSFTNFTSLRAIPHEVGRGNGMKLLNIINAVSATITTLLKLY